MAEVLIVETKEAAGAVVADHIAAQVAANPAFTLGVATGSTPLPVYQALAAHAAAGVDFSAVTAFALDEYVGIAEDHPESLPLGHRTGGDGTAGPRPGSGSRARWHWQ
ncbi:hypothetical protein GCM10025876_25870 [Demequina litorisediminis]|uniref:Glucosamine/galactosamine-6-phosphate isomerase domain-containing protein n=1 Tax=Demequina litorisediminis TaxID=1849022 RepID=A0ABQ6IER7_9MICO|nr:hypothetical protein GCM10025876_25870 [Demequina litorisediminis]